MFQTYDIGLGNFLLPLIAVVVMIFTVIFAIYTYTKIRRVIVILIIWIFAVPFSLMSMNIPWFPFTPWFQLFFMLIITAFLIMLVFEAFKK